MSSEIRPADDGDAEGIAEIYAPIVRDTAISFELDPPSANEMRKRIGDTLKSLPWLVCTDSQGIRGYAYAGHYRARPAYRWSLEVSVYVARDTRRQGVGERLYRALFETVARQGYCRAYAGITLPNEASVKLHQALGFTPVGIYREVGYKFAEWRDVGWWQLALGDPVAEPEDPLDFESVRPSLNWDRW
jgi:L-amino acid N-acyltransferase YncA